jgi:Fanconi anemia group J protein
MSQLQQVKAVFSEPRQAGDAFDTVIRNFYEAVDGGQGGLFMAVCRGKVRTGRLQLPALLLLLSL